jgi:hypothetical protein
MKPLLVIAFTLTAFASRQHSPTPTEFRCLLTCDKEVYKVGELPRLTVRIYNNTKDDVYFIGSLDGSDVKWRFPYCYYTIDRPKAGKEKLQRCRNMNTLRVEDFKLVRSGQSFDPYESIDNYGFFTDYTTANKEMFKHVGVYKIKFHYSTNSIDINQFIGDKPFRSNYSDSLRVDSLFKAVPKVELLSNEIVFRVDK